MFDIDRTHLWLTRLLGPADEATLRLAALS